MQFRNFTWPNEPSSLRVTSRRRTALLEEPGGGWTLQDLGTAARTVTGEGVFFGETAYDTAGSFSICAASEIVDIGVLNSCVILLIKSFFISVSFF